MRVVDVGCDGSQIVTGCPCAVDGEHGGFQAFLGRLMTFEADPLVGRLRCFHVVRRGAEILLSLTKPSLGLA